MSTLGVLLALAESAVLRTGDPLKDGAKFGEQTWPLLKIGERTVVIHYE